jgi:hypothetical protein
LRSFFTRPHRRLALVLITVTALVFTGVVRLRKDPNLLSYFAKGSILRQGLEHVDRNLGSSPLTLVVRDPHGAHRPRAQELHEPERRCDVLSLPHRVTFLKSM